MSINLPQAFELSRGASSDFEVDGFFNQGTTEWLEIKPEMYPVPCGDVGQTGALLRELVGNNHSNRNAAEMPTHFECDWELEIQYYPKDVVDYGLYFFLGPVPSSPAEWESSPSRLFEPIVSQVPRPTTEFRHINGYLDYHCGKDTLKDDDVIPYLRDHLTWGVKKRYEDEAIEKSRLKLKVAVHGDGASDVIYDNFRCEGTIAPFES